MDYQKLFEIAEEILIIRGGATSGNWGHSGRPGKKGGSGRGGGFGRIGIKDGKAGRGKVKQASRQTRAKDERAKGGGVKVGSGEIPAGAVGRARDVVAKAKVERDRNLKKVIAVDKEIQKAAAANEKASAEWAKADERALKSLKASNDHREKINKVAEKEIEAGRLSPWAMRETNETLRPLLEKQKRLDERDKANYEKANEADRKLRETSKALDSAIDKRNSLPQGLQFTDEVMGAYSKETDQASKVLFQHHLNEGKRVRAQMKEEIRTHTEKLDGLNKKRKSLEAVEEKLIIKMQNSNYPDNDPRAIALIEESFKVSDEIGQTNRQIRKLGKEGAARAESLVRVENSTKIATAPGSQRDPQIASKDGWKKGREGFESLVNDDVVPSGVLVRFKRTKENRSYHSGNTISEVNMSDFSGPNTMVHELGHMAENYNARLLKRSIEWRDNRTKGETLKQLSDVTGNQGYDDRERTKADKFFSAYIGKDYGDRATEVFSMGIERMHKDPIGFANQDPDMFDFIYAQARTP